MYIALVILHILVAFVMVGVILLQSGKGAEIGAAFGGSSQTVFGSRGAGTFLSKMTAVAATIFMLTSLSLAILSKRLNYSSTIGLDKPLSSPAAPAASPPGVPAPVQPMTDQQPHDSNAPPPKP
jgi:preprotein translocase subunit SecG